MAAPETITRLSASSVNSRGVTGLRRGMGETQIYNEFLQQLQGLRGLDIYWQIACNSPVVGASLVAIRSYLLRAPLIVTPAGDRPRHKDAAAMVERALPPRLIRDLMDDASSMLIFGFALAEMLFGQDPDTREWGVQKLPPRAARSVQGWLWDEELDEPWAFVQQPWAGGRRVVPLSRCLHMRTSRGEADSPAGTSLLRNCYSAEFFSRRLQELEGIGVERDLVGLPVLKVPGQMLDPAASAEQKAALGSFESMLKDIRRDKSEGVILPSDVDEQGNRYFELELLSVSGNRQVDISQAIERHEKRIAQSFLTEFLFLGVSGGGTGSYALASDKTTMFKASLRSLLNVVSDQISARLVPQLIGMNGYRRDTAPEVRFGDLDAPSIGEMGKFVKDLADSGMLTPDPDTENHLRDAAGMPQRPEGAPMPAPDPAPATSPSAL